MQNNITTLLLGIQDAQVTGVSEERSLITIDCKSVHDRACPHCSSSHVWGHDHREQVLRDAAMRRKHVLLRVKKTLYDCKDCGARFEAPLSFVGMGKQMTKRFIAYAVDAFRAIPSISELAQEAGISSTRIFRIVACLCLVNGYHVSFASTSFLHRTNGKASWPPCSRGVKPFVPPTF